MTEVARKLRVLKGGADLPPPLPPPLLDLSEDDRHSGLWILAALLALGGHLAAIVILARLVNEERPHLEDPISFSVVEPPPPEVEVEPPPPPPPPPEPKPPPIIDMERATIVEKAPPPDPNPQPLDGPPPVFGVSMSSTVSKGGSFQVQVGNTVRADPKAPRPDGPIEEGPPAVSFQAIEKPPRVLKEVKADYPPEARAEGLEGLVLLKLTINDQGRVTQAKVVKGPDPRLNEAARAAVLQFRFKPGEVGGVAVITTNFVYRYLWVIEQ